MNDYLHTLPYLKYFWQKLERQSKLRAQRECDMLMAGLLMIPNIRFHYFD